MSTCLSQEFLVWDRAAFALGSGVTAAERNLVHRETVVVPHEVWR